MPTTSLVPRWDAAAAPFRHTWNHVCNIDQFRWLPRADVLAHLRQAHDRLGIRHVRACAMYSPEMRVWGHDLADWRKPHEEKGLRANWQCVDIAIEGLLDLGLKPIYTTCFTPVGMTDDGGPTCWPDRNPTGMPRDLGQWADFVAAGLRHHLARYGREELRSWYFECWNEPNLKGGFFGGDRDDFFRLWSATWRAIKSVDPELRFGGPSTARGEWIPEFLDFTAKDGTPPDYLITHVYNNDSECQPLSPFDGPASHKVKDSPHFATGVVRGLRRELDRRGWRGEVHWNEWGRSWFPYDLLKETPLEAAFIVKTMAEVSQDADAFAFWCLSDIYDQGGFSSAEFQGNYGLLSLHGLGKPAWMAHLLLERLGQERFLCDGGDDLVNAVISRKDDALQALAYAYPAAIDAPADRLTVEIALPEGVDAPRLFRIGTTDNNIVAQWRAMGAPAYPTPSQLCELRTANELRESPGTVQMVPGKDGTQVATFAIERPGVALLECRRTPQA
jgi:xylan 1,4-beta-xylosidase